MIGTSPAPRLKADSLPIRAAIVLLPVAAAVAVGRAPVTAAVAFVAAAFLLGAALSPGLALTSILVSALVLPGVQSWIGLPFQALLLTRLLMGVFAISALLHMRRGREVYVHLTLMLAWAAVLVASAVFGESEPLLAGQALLAYLCGPVTFLAILFAGLSARSLANVARIVGVLLCLQLPVVLFQNGFVATHVDQIGGTFGAVGGTSIIAVLMSFCWVTAVALLEGRRRLWLVPIALGVATVLLVVEAKAGFLFAALGTIVVGAVRAAYTRRFATVTFRYAAGAAGAVAALYGGYRYVGEWLKGGRRAAQVALADIGSRGAVMDYLFSYGPEGEAGRLEGVRLAVALGSTRLTDLVIGHGPGLLSADNPLGGTSDFAMRTGAMFDWATSVTRSILETGVLGTALYVAIVFAAVRTVATSWRPSGPAGHRVVAACAGVAVVYLVAGAYSTAWLGPLQVLFWCGAGMAARWGLLTAEAGAAPAAASGDAA